LRESQKKILITVCSSFVYGLLVLFIGLMISFPVYYLGIRSPFMNQIPGNVIDPTRYDIELIRLGVSDPWFIQFVRYIGRFFRGDWGLSFLINEGMPTIQLMREIVPHTIELVLLPMIIGIGGVILVRILERRNKKVINTIIQILTVIGLATPIFLFGTMMQLVVGLNTDFPVVYRKTPSLPDPPYITGFDTFDSIITGNWDLAFDYILHSLLPWFILCLLITSLFIKMTRTRIETKPKDVNFTPNAFLTAKVFGYLFPMTLLLELTFNLTGFGYNFYLSVVMGDIFVIVSCLFTFIIFFACAIFLSNIVPLCYTLLRKKVPKFFKLFHRKDDPQPTNPKQEIEKIPNNQPNVKSEIKSYKYQANHKNRFFCLIKFYSIPGWRYPEFEANEYEIGKTKSKRKAFRRLFSPLAIAGIVIVLIIVFIGVFTPWLTPFTVDNITPPDFLPETPFLRPSPEHPLGTTQYGFDILGRIIWGTRSALIFGIIVVLIGLGFGSQFGFLAGKFNRYVYHGIIGSMLIFFIIPGLALIMVFLPLYYFIDLPISIPIGILLIPVFSAIVANAVRRKKNGFDIIKSVIKYIPLELAFAILMYQSLGFIGLTDERIPQLGVDINYGRGQWGAYYAVFWPGFFIFLILLGLLLLHEGLKVPPLQQKVLDENIREKEVEI
jgi:ABC-type dipeptide/oligopeptide/nickel transport system permease subunit